MADHDESGERAKKNSSSAKTKDLSHVPCKFFKVGGCTAGASCPFSHSSAEPGQPKESCTWFVKGNCKFGHKCALAHVLPGQPMSMDRKNKKAAQQANQQSQPQKRPAKRDPASTSGQQPARLPLLAGGSTAPTRILNATAPKDRLKAAISPSAPAPPLKDTDFAPIVDGMEGVESDHEPDVPKDSGSEEATKPASPVHLPLSAPRPSAAPPAADFGPVGSPRNGLAFSPGTSPRNAPQPASPPVSSSYTAPGIAASLGSSLAIMHARKEQQQQQPLPQPQTSLLTARMVESAVEDDDLDVIPGSLTDLLTPEERKRRFSRNSSALHHQPLSESLNMGHRYSRSVPAAGLLGDIKGIWADPSPQQTPPQRAIPSYSTGFEPDLSSLSISGGTPSSLGGITPSNASAAFLPGNNLHSQYLSAKAKQAQQAQLGQAQGGLSRVLRGASNPSAVAATNLANNYLQPLGGLGLPSSVSSSTLHTHIHGGTATTYRTTPSPFDLTHHPAPPLSAIQDEHHLVSPSTRALQSHAPGQSLPQGLGYSRIHALPPLPNIVSPPLSSSPGGASYAGLLNPMGDTDWSGVDTGFSRIPSGNPYSGGLRAAPSGVGAPPGLSRNVSGPMGRVPLSPLGVGVVNDDDLFDMDK